MKKGQKKTKLKFSREILLQRFKDASDLLGHQVSYREMKRLKGFPSMGSFKAYFEGKWSNVVSAAGGVILPRRKPKAILKNPWASLSMRFEVFKRDNFTCQYCGRTPQDGAKLVADHKLAVANGGLTEISNLITSCFECNAGKSDAILSSPNRRIRAKKGKASTVFTAP
jgi:hypothetical protein